VCTIAPEGQIFRADFSQSVGSSHCLVASVSAELWKWHRRLGHLLSFDLLLEWARTSPRIAKIEIPKGFGMCSV
jgi:hypothetical protein